MQIEANDGLAHDPVQEIISGLSLPAILVEPLRELFERLIEDYKATKNIIFENFAISDKHRIAEIFRVSGNHKFAIQDVAGLDKSFLTRENKYSSELVGKYKSSVEVPVVTIRQLLQNHRNPRVNALQIDAEGHNCALIKSAAAAGRLSRIINYESKHLSINDQIECRELLALEGYSFLTNFVGKLIIATTPSGRRSVAFRAFSSKADRFANGYSYW